VDTLSPSERSERMSRIRSVDTKPEMAVRRLVYRLGYRYRLRSRLPGRPDLVFLGRKKAIFVHGCFWHRHDSPACRLARLPKTRLDFWLPKLEGNRERDQKAVEELKRLGIEVLVVWECELKDEGELEMRVREFLR